MPDTAPPEDPAQRTAAFVLCGLGLSAGGLSALREFFAEIGAVDGVSFVVVQHHSIADSNHMNVLAGFSPYPVVACEQGMRIVPSGLRAGLRGAWTRALKSKRTASSKDWCCTEKMDGAAFASRCSRCRRWERTKALI